MIILFLSIIFAFIYYNCSTSKYYSNTNCIEGILEEYSIDGNKLSFTIRAKEKVKGIYYIEREQDLDYYNNLKIGYKLKIEGSLTEPSINTIPNTFNYQKYLKTKGIYWTMKVTKITIVATELNAYYKFKNWFNEYINNFKSKVYLNLFILGDKSYLTQDIYENYQNLGVSHIFAISGMHVSLLSIIILKILKRTKENIKYLITITFLLFYLILLDFQPSVMRSVLLFLFLYFNKKCDLQIETINILYLVVATILVFKPMYIFNVGFLYSSVISWALIKYSKYISGSYVKKCLKISSIAFLFSLPITINNNFEINILSILNNLFFVPFISFIIYPLSLIVLIIKPLDPILFFLISILERVSNNFLVLNVIVPKMNFLFILIYYILLFILFESNNKKVFFLIISLLIVHKFQYLIDNNYYVYILDVGQGDSAIIRYKNQCVMIDTGGKVSFDTGWKKKKEYNLSDNTITLLKSIGINHINYMIISHGDYDHMGEAINIVNTFKVENVILNCGSYNDLEKELIKILDKKKISYFSCIKELNIGNSKLYFLQTKEYDNENDNSNVIYTEINGYKFMFMGDAGIEKEQDILDKYNLLNIDVLKVGHHGSKTSSSKNFINEINPKYGIISVGKNNRYRHPNNEVLNNLKASTIYRTDIDGSIMFKIKKDKLKIETCPP